VPTQVVCQIDPSVRPKIIASFGRFHFNRIMISINFFSWLITVWFMVIGNTLGE
jgi:flagellar biosynthesis component FlhA